MKTGREVQLACQMREPLEKEHVFQSSGRKELYDLFQVLGKCHEHRLQVARNLPIAVDFSHNKCLMQSLAIGVHAQ